jgi:hypothetical protein
MANQHICHFGQYKIRRRLTHLMGSTDLFCILALGLISTATMDAIR